jgi:hypothetical protein
LLCIEQQEEMAEQQQGVIGAKDLANLKEQLERMPRDKDRLRLITAAAEGHSFTCVRHPIYFFYYLLFLFAFSKFR